MNDQGKSVLAGLVSLAWLCGTACSTAHPPLAELDAFQDWRQQREEALRSPSGYLALSGLFWLQEGVHTFGSGPQNDIVFPAGHAPEQAGTFRVKGRQVTVSSASGVTLTADGQPVETMRMISDAQDTEPTKFQLGALTFWLIERAGRPAIRLSDPQSAILKNYSGTKTFPCTARWRVPARFEPFEAPQTVAVPTIMGTPADMESTGKLAFTVDGAVHELQTMDMSETEYFIIFGDRTNGTDTYGGGRFLRVPIADPDGNTVIDFNRAYNPPCAYSPYTTCPLPPRQNKLPFRVEAGERIEGIKAQH